jgi:hypothetical protein
VSVKTGTPQRMGHLVAESGKHGHGCSFARTFLALLEAVAAMWHTDDGDDDDIQHCRFKATDKPLCRPRQARAAETAPLCQSQTDR